MLPHGGSLDSATKSYILDNGVGVAKLSKPVIIVIAVSGIVGSFIGLVFLFKCFLRPKFPPLPPKQPLANRRETSMYLPRPYLLGKNMELDRISRYGSEKSSLRLSRMQSFRTADSSVILSSSYRASWISTLPKNNDTCWPGQLSAESNSDEYVSTTQCYPSTTSLAHSASIPRSRQQLYCGSSMGSARSVSMRSANTTCRAPHSPYSDVEVVLPAPLAPRLQDHMIVNPPTVQGGGAWLEKDDISDRWMAASIRTTSWRFSIGDTSPGRETSSSLGQQDRYSSDILDQLRRSESQTRPRGRSTSLHPIQRQFLGLGDPISPPQSPGNRTRLTKSISRGSCNGQGTFMYTTSRNALTELLQLTAPQPPFEQRDRSPGYPKARLRSRCRSFPRDSRPSGNTSCLPFPKCVAHSWHRYTPSWDESPPPPVPPLPQLSQDLPYKPNTHYFLDPIPRLSPISMILLDPLCDVPSTLRTFPP